MPFEVKARNDKNASIKTLSASGSHCSGRMCKVPPGNRCSKKQHTDLVRICQGHGGLDTIYADLEIRCQSKGWLLSDIDLLIICGDFQVRTYHLLSAENREVLTSQAVRNEQDLNCMSVPRRYRQLGDFHKYYSQQTRAPVLTLVIGGNHEASNYFFELYHGGWLAPNIYHLGAASVVRYGPWRISGLSGIYNTKDYRKPHHERLPYSRDDLRSVYHVREYDVQKLLSVSGNVDIALSHDWPAWVELFGDFAGLYRSKPHFLESAKRDGLGSKPATQLLDHLRPRHWFSGHMHVRFPATVRHGEVSIEDTIRKLPVTEQQNRDLPVFRPKYTVALTPPTPGVQRNPNETTSFLALGKVGDDSSDYLELLELDPPDRPNEHQMLESNADGKFGLYYDSEWLAITRAYNDSLRLTDPGILAMPTASRGECAVSADSIAHHKSWLEEHVVAQGLLGIPDSFSVHAPVYVPGAANMTEQPLEFPNSQTAEFARLLQMQNKFHIPLEAGEDERQSVEIQFE